MHLYFDLVGGVAGDMILASLVDLSKADDLLRSVPKRLKLPGVTVDIERTARHQLASTLVKVNIPDEGEHRHLSHIRSILMEADLPETVSASALTVFQRLAVAEAHVHDSDPEKIHFHEVGADDALVDIAGACLLLHEIGPETVSGGVMPVCRGLTQAAHGGIPLPAPAVLELVGEWPLEWISGEGERVTPTGAALMTSLARYGRPPVGSVRASGSGAGSADFADRPNIVRALLIEPEDAGSAGDTEEIVELVAAVDDATGEELGHAAQILLGAGALDVYYAPLVMKKSRPGWEITILARPADVNGLTQMALRHTGSAGIRHRTIRRCVLPRQFVTVQTEHGEVRIKEFTSADGFVRSVPEYEDCRLIAEKTRLPLRHIQQLALEGYRRIKDRT